jgi:hypothetical protein
VDIADEGRSHLRDIATCALLIKTSLSLDTLTKTLSLDILHNVVCSTILLKEIPDINDIGVAHLRELARLIQEFSLKYLHTLLSAITNSRDGVATNTMAQLFCKKLFYTDSRTKRCLLSKIGDTKTALPNSRDYAIVATLKQSAGLQKW